jgi:hypothetical protein
MATEPHGLSLGTKPTGQEGLRLREGTYETYMSPGKNITLYQDGARTLTSESSDHNKCEQEGNL